MLTNEVVSFEQPGPVCLQHLIRAFALNGILILFSAQAGPGSFIHIMKLLLTFSLF